MEASRVLCFDKIQIELRLPLELLGRGQIAIRSTRSFGRLQI